MGPFSSRGPPRPKPRPGAPPNRPAQPPRQPAMADRHYAFARILISDPAWIARYVEEVTPILERMGGRYLARTPVVEVIEGEAAADGETVLLTEWPSREAALAFYESDEYRPYRDSRQAGSSGDFVLFPAGDATGAATQ